LQDAVHQRVDLAGGGLRLIGELADLGRDDREAASLLAGTRGLDRGVERQQLVWLATSVTMLVMLPICDACSFR
jgi:hypothetical protein